MKLLVQLALVALIGGGEASAEDLWQMARQKARVYRLSALFTAPDVRDSLSTEKGLSEAVAWCKQTGITKVYLETYQAKYQASQETLIKARDRFKHEGFRVAGAITPTEVGKISTGWKIISCFTNPGTQTDLRSIVEFTAQIFDVIIIDDYLFTDCSCDECDAARKRKEVRIRTKVYPVASDSWEDYRSELMLQVSRAIVVGAAKRINPNARVIIKFPLWYDLYQDRGYDVERETAVFDGVWVGTETRDRSNPLAKPQYGAYFLLRWIGGIAGRKLGGGWFDSENTSAKTYVEQARQTVLGGAKEAVLASYGELHRNFGPEDIAALRSSIPELLEVAAQVRRRRPAGVAAYKPPGSVAGAEQMIFDYVGLLGIPLAPVHTFPVKAKAAFLPLHAWSDPDLVERLNAFVDSGKPVLLTDGLARRLAGKVKFGAARVLRVGQKPSSVLEMTQRQVDDLRQPLLKALGVEFQAPVDVALYLFTDGSWVVENFGNRDARVRLNGQAMMLGRREWVYEWK